MKTAQTVMSLLSDNAIENMIFEGALAQVKSGLALSSVSYFDDMGGEIVLNRDHAVQSKSLDTLFNLALEEKSGTEIGISDYVKSLIADVEKQFSDIEIPEHIASISAEPVRLNGNDGMSKENLQAIKDAGYSLVQAGNAFDTDGASFWFVKVPSNQGTENFEVLCDNYLAIVNWNFRDEIWSCTCMLPKNSKRDYSGLDTVEIKSNRSYKSFSEVKDVVELWKSLG